MTRSPLALGAFALLALACQHPPAATAQQRAAMGPDVEARLLQKKLAVKAQVTGVQSEHLKIVGESMSPDTVETLVIRGVVSDLCNAGFVDIDFSDGLGWKKLWKC
jgi:hypothetical protein